MSFDARSLLIIGGFLCWILAAALEFQTVRPDSRRVMPDAWTLGLLAKGLGLNLISQRGLIDDVWTIAVAHALLLSSVLFVYAALQRIRGAVTSRLMIAAIPVGLGISLPIIGFSDDAFQARVFVVMCAWLFAFSLACWGAVQVARAGYLAGAALILGSNAAVAVFAIAFGAAVASQEVPGVFGAGGVQLAFYAVHDVCIVVATYGYMDIVRAARLQHGKFDGAARPDSVTGLFSNATFTRVGAGELARAASAGYPVCAMALRIDSLDAVRDSRGPAFADEALRRVAGITLREIRIQDVAGRVSAGDFGVLMPELPLSAGREVAERIRAKVAVDPPGADGGPRIEVSIGLCSTGGEQVALAALMAQALACVDRARARGGNRVVTQEAGSGPAYGAG